MIPSPGALFRKLVFENPPLQVLGAVNAYAAMLAKAAGAQALYLSGAGVANASYGLPDLGMTGLAEILEDVRRVTEACSLPLLVDVDTGFGHMFNIRRTVQLMEKSGVAAIHIEDQLAAKRCGHRPNKSIVSMEEMGSRIKAAVDARHDVDFVIMARTDAYASEGLQGAIERAQYYVSVGADMIFAEALSSLSDYREFVKQVNVPILANITEFGKTPLFTRDELFEVGVRLILYPLSAFRAMSQAAFSVYQTIMQQGTQQSKIAEMQTRENLYDLLNYTEFEKKLDNCLEKENG